MKIDCLPEVDLVVDNTGKEQHIILSQKGHSIRWLSKKILMQFPQENIIGLVFTTSEELILHWLAVLDAGKCPVILQYPTAKLSHEYWIQSTTHSISDISIEGIIHSNKLIMDLHSLNVHVEAFDGYIGIDDEKCVEIHENRGIIQLSSGTTGFRKAVYFSLDDVRHHCSCYNQVMKLNCNDVIVSWLPLYHDMGFIACFVMPLLLGIPLVMMDPMVWVQSKQLLFKCIEKHHGTICYMPNFGFEVMAKERPQYLLDSMRLWISCSEPTSRDSIQRFCQATDTDVASVAVCYAMAENVFAISQKNGINTIEKDGVHIVCCGSLLPQTEAKIVEGEIYIRSSVSLSCYMNGTTITDSEGYYASGDYGFFHQGELYIEGRKRDILIQAGKKYFLSDFDLIVNSIVPDCNGRAACLALDDALIGTQKLVILIERENFYIPDEKKQIAEMLKNVLPLEVFESYLVPDNFITKTSSGKVNRKKTLDDFRLMQAWSISRSAHKSRQHIEMKIKQYFSAYPQNCAVKEVLDSLGKVLFDVISEEMGMKISYDNSIQDLLAFCNKSDNKVMHEKELSGYIHIVLLVDSARDFIFSEDAVRRIEEAIGLPVKIEHIAMPPASIILHDLVFCDYFLCRGYNSNYDAYLDCVYKIKNASIIIVSDTYEFVDHFSHIAFPVMSHRFERSFVAEFFGARRERYAANHHLLPIGDMIGKNEIPLASRNETYTKLQTYLQGTPIFRMAFLQKFEQYTQGWEYCDREYSDLAQKAKQVTTLRSWREENESILDQLIQFMIKNKPQMNLHYGERPDSSRIYIDPPHCCFFLVNPFRVEKTLRHLNGFLINGIMNSVAYIPKRIGEMNKSCEYLFRFPPNQDINMLNFECIIETGMGRAIPKSNILKPYVEFVQTGWQDQKYLDEVLPIDFCLNELYVGDSQTFALLRKMDKIKFLAWCDGQLSQEESENNIGLIDLLYKQGLVGSGIKKLRQLDLKNNSSVPLSILLRSIHFALLYQYDDQDDWNWLVKRIKLSQETDCVSDLAELIVSYDFIDDKIIQKKQIVRSIHAIYCWFKDEREDFYANSLIEASMLILWREAGFKHGEKYLHELIKMQCKNELLYYLMGMIQLKLNKMQEAHEFFSKINSKLPKRLMAAASYQCVWHFLTQGGNNDSTFQMANILWQNAKRSALANLLLSLLLKIDGVEDESVQKFEQFIRLVDKEPNSIICDANIGDIKEVLMRLDFSFLKSTALSPDAKQKLFYLLQNGCESFENDENYTSARALIEKAEKLFSDDEELYQLKQELQKRADTEQILK